MSKDRKNRRHRLEGSSNEQSNSQQRPLTKHEKKLLHLRATTPQPQIHETPGAWLLDVPVLFLSVIGVILPLSAFFYQAVGAGGIDFALDFFFKTLLRKGKRGIRSDSTGTVKIRPGENPEADSHKHSNGFMNNFFGDLSAHMVYLLDIPREVLKDPENLDVNWLHKVSNSITGHWEIDVDGESQWVADSESGSSTPQNPLSEPSGSPLSLPKNFDLISRHPVEWYKGQEFSKSLPHWFRRVFLTFPVGATSFYISLGLGLFIGILLPVLLVLFVVPDSENCFWLSSEEGKRRWRVWFGGRREVRMKKRKNAEEQEEQADTTVASEDSGSVNENLHLDSDFDARFSREMCAEFMQRYWVPYEMEQNKIDQQKKHVQRFNRACGMGTAGHIAQSRAVENSSTVNTAQSVEGTGPGANSASQKDSLLENSLELSYLGPGGVTKDTNAATKQDMSQNDVDEHVHESFNTSGHSGGSDGEVVPISTLAGCVNLTESGSSGVSSSSKTSTTKECESRNSANSDFNFVNSEAEASKLPPVTFTLHHESMQTDELSQLSQMSSELHSPSGAGFGVGSAEKSGRGGAGH